MSLQYTEAVWRSKLEWPDEKLVLLCLAGLADGKGRAFATVKLLSLRCSMTPLEVRGALGRLRLQGFLIIERERTKWRTADLYTVMIPGDHPPPAWPDLISAGAAEVNPR